MLRFDIFTGNPADIGGWGAPDIYINPAAVASVEEMVKCEVSVAVISMTTGEKHVVLDNQQVRVGAQLSRHVGYQKLPVKIYGCEVFADCQSPPLFGRICKFMERLAK